jgi:hypothetical protein
MNIEIDDIDDRKRQKIQLCFFCTEELRDKLLMCKRLFSNSLSGTIRKLLYLGMKNIKQKKEE